MVLALKVAKMVSHILVYMKIRGCLCTKGYIYLVLFPDSFSEMFWLHLESYIGKKKPQKQANKH